MSANRLEITVAETKTDEVEETEETTPELTEAEREAIEASKVPVTKETGKPVTTAKPKAKEKKELPISAANGSFYASLDENANGIPTVNILPVGWVGAAPLQIPEGELADLIAVLNKLKR